MPMKFKVYALPVIGGLWIGAAILPEQGAAALACTLLLLLLVLTKQVDLI